MSAEEQLNGGPAFPPHDMRMGMSLRDYFASYAMSGLMANGEGISNLAKSSGNSLPQAVAMRSYAIADAMLEQRQFARGVK